jgi:hypothetical protein
VDGQAKEGEADETTWLKNVANECPPINYISVANGQHHLVPETCQLPNIFELMPSEAEVIQDSEEWNKSQFLEHWDQFLKTIKAKGLAVALGKKRPQKLFGKPALKSRFDCSEFDDAIRASAMVCKLSEWTLEQRGGGTVNLNRYRNGNVLKFGTPNLDDCQMDAMRIVSELRDDNSHGWDKVGERAQGSFSHALRKFPDGVCGAITAVAVHFERDHGLTGMSDFFEWVCGGRDR